MAADAVAADGGCGRDVVHRMNEGYRAYGALGIKSKRCLYKGVIVQKAVYGAEAWSI